MGNVSVLFLSTKWTSVIARAFLLGEILFLLGRLAVFAETKRVLNLCEVLRDFDHHAGQVIEVEGDYIVGRESIGLYEKCEPPITFAGVVVPTAVAVRFPQAMRIGDHAVDFDSLRRLREDVQQDRRRASGPGFRVVIKGRLNSADEISWYVDKSGQRRPMGFGHLSAFPFQIELIRVVSINKVTAR